MQLLEILKGGRYVRYIIKLDDENIIEFSDNTLTTRQNRWVICIPTQIGCQVGCFMCGSWKIKYQRSLRAEEMAELVKFAIRQQPIKPERSKNFAISFLGIGEPTLNIEEVKKAVKLFRESYPFCKLIISSVGIKKSNMELLQLAIFYKVGLQFSLLGFTDQERGASVKFGEKHLLSLPDICKIGMEFFTATGSKCYLDFLVKSQHQEQILEGVKMLSEIFTPTDYFHFSINVGAELGNPPQYQPPAPEVSEKLFSAIKKYGYEVSFHRPLGVDNGCGIITAKNAESAAR